MFACDFTRTRDTSVRSQEGGRTTMHTLPADSVCCAALADQTKPIDTQPTITSANDPKFLNLNKCGSFSIDK